MDLLLLRHADALDYAATDHERPLSPKGHQQAALVAELLSGYRVRPTLLLSSPARRTLETAAPLAKALGLAVTHCTWALPGMTPAGGVDGIGRHLPAPCILLVGHQPDLGDLAANLLGRPATDHLNFQKATLAHLTLRPGQPAVLEALIPCQLQ
jgi:phosphohistidine phosphatase